jgi:acyl-CoA reductase-like NAD-dependent aldehyde dehydrogenase
MSEIAKHWIDGEWTGSDTVSESVNPATGAVLGRWADGGEAEARAAARRAFDTSPWSRDRSLRHRVLNEMAGLLENVRVGDGMDPQTDMGPLIDKADVTRVDGMVQAALAYAKPIVRGGPATDGALAAGAFYRPALLEVEDVNTEIVQREVFGPVATFEVFDTEADAIARANATEYGLAADIFTTSINISRRVSREIHAGTVWTNTWAAINDGFAEDGYKQSGTGRLRGPLAITEFQEAKTVVHAIPQFQG